MIKNDFANRDLSGVAAGAVAGDAGAAPRPGGRVKRPKEAIKIRLDAGEYALLQDIAERQGSKASILIRQAVKEIIRKNGGGF
jgi:hypothetical protein